MAFVKFYQFVEDLSKGVHNLSSDSTCTIMVALTNSAPSQSNTVLADLTEVNYTYCSSRIVTGVTAEQTLGVVTYTASNLTLTASGGTIGPFRYVSLFNADAIGSALISYADYGSSITINDGGTFLINFGVTGFGTLS